jgi:hypothetical protein
LDGKESRNSASSLVALTLRQPEVISIAPRKQESPLAPSLAPTMERESCDCDEVRAVAQIDKAHERLHRIQTMLAFLAGGETAMQRVTDCLDEAKHTYMEAIARCATREFDRAYSFAAASHSFSLAVEVIISRGLDVLPAFGNACKARAVPAATLNSRGEARWELSRIVQRAHEVRRSAEEVASSCEVRRIGRICSWAESQCHWSDRLFDAGADQDALESMRAAEAAVFAVGHLLNCRNDLRTAKSD